MDAETVHELSAAYALDALEPDEREAFEEHLAGVRELPRGASPSWWRSPRSSPGRSSRPRLRPRSATASSRRRAPSGRTSSRCGPRPGVARSRRRRRRGVRGARRSGSGTSRCTTSSPTRARQALERRPGRGAARAPSSSARGGSAALVAFRLPAAPAGKTYEAWVIARQERRAGRAVPGRRRRHVRPDRRQGAQGHARRGDGRAGRRLGAADDEAPSRSRRPSERRDPRTDVCASSRTRRA